jgi:HAMP domain-containing protein
MALTIVGVIVVTAPLWMFVGYVYIIPGASFAIFIWALVRRALRAIKRGRRPTAAGEYDISN